MYYICMYVCVLNIPPPPPTHTHTHTHTQPSSGGSRDPVGHVLELKLKALILDTVHSMDIVQTLIQNNIKKIGDWLWQKQLRFYLKNGELRAKLLILCFSAGWGCML